MAPVFQESTFDAFEQDLTVRDVYLPGPAEWTDMWSGELYTVDEQGLWLREFEAPISYPPIFYYDSRIFKFSELLAGYRDFQPSDSDD